MGARSLALGLVLLLATPGLAGCVVPEDMPALREELGYAEVDRPELVVRARASDHAPTVGEPVNLSAEVEGSPTRAVDVTWDVNGTEREGLQTSVRFDEPGRQPVRVEAVGPNGTRASDRLVLEVEPNAAPEPALAVEGEDHRVGEPVAISAAGSRDADGDELSYDWWLDGEPVEAGPRLERALPAGAHEVRVRVSDGLEARSTSRAFAVDHPIHHEANLTLTRTAARLTVPVEPGLASAEIELVHSTRAGLDDVNLTLRTAAGEVLARSDTPPEPGAERARERLTLDGADAEPGPHTVVAHLDRGVGASLTIEGVFTYSPLPAQPG